MALPALATVTDLEHAMQVATGSLDSSQAALALSRASARVRRHTGQDISFVSQETVELPGGGQVLALPERPAVVDGSNPLTVVELPGIGDTEVPAVEGTDFRRLGNELTRGHDLYWRTRTGGWPWNRTLGVWAPRVRVTYSHGYTDVPGDIVDIVLDLATMNMTNPSGLRSVSIDDYSQTFATETVGGARLTREHRADLRPYKRIAFSVAPS